MLPSMLLVVEVVLLAATGYIFWLTRKLLSEARSQPPLPAASNLEVAHDVAEMLAELQAAANAARTDWARQHAIMQEMVQRAEHASRELRSLLAQTTCIQGASPAEATSAPEPASDQTEITMGKALTAFGEALRRRGQHQNSVGRVLSNLREFALWWGGRHWESLRLCQLEPDDVDNYVAYLKARQYKPITFKRKQAALRSFVNWAGTAMPARPGYTNSPRAKEEDPVTSTPSHANSDYCAAALALYGQGLDLETIAARTGLEREAVRMLLTLGPPAHVSN